jgi:hypothetical protein
MTAPRGGDWTKEGNTKQLNQQEQQKLKYENKNNNIIGDNVHD